MPPITSTAQVVITYDTWMQDTARTAFPRSAQLKAVDAAFLTFAKLGTADARDALRAALDAWKASAGPGDAWKRSERNRLRAVDRLTALVEGRGDSDTAFGHGLVPDFMHEELINARLGVLYLFGRLDVNPNLFKLVLDGGLDIAGQAMSVGGASDAAQSAFGHASRAGAPAAAAGSYAEGKLATKAAPPNQYLPPGLPSSQLAGPDATTRVEVYAAKIASDARAAELLAQRPLTQKVLDKVEGWFALLVEKIKATLREKFGTFDDALETVAGGVKAVVKGCVALFAAKAAPFVGGAFEVASSLARTVDAAGTRFRAWRDGRNVEVADGHPGVVVQSISRAMTLSLFEGLWGTLKGAGALAMDAVGFGAGGLVNLLIAIGELLIKFIWRAVEVVRMRTFCAQAAEHWRNHQSEDALHRRPFAFSAWYRKYALDIPALSILTLNSGVCGDKMRFLSMYSSQGGGLLSSAAFLAGARYVDSLKPWGAQYLADSGFGFSSGDALVNALVTDFAASHSAARTNFQRVLSVIAA